MFLLAQFPRDLLKPIPDFHFTPVSNQLFYGLTKILFGPNPLAFHLVLFLFSSLTLLLVHQISRHLLKNNLKAYMSVFFYALNVSLFANYYWVAISYFVIGGFFFFLTVFAYIKQGIFWKLVTIAALVCAFLSNEIGYLLPAVLLLCDMYQSRFKRSWIVLAAITSVVAIIRWLLVPKPVGQNYLLAFNWQVISTIRWYLLRVFNLPEGVRFSQQPEILILFVVFILLLAIVALWRFKAKSYPLRLTLFAAAWFLIGALPFYFLPNHMSAYYLTIALLGPALLFSELLAVKKIWLLALGVYLLLSWSGLLFLQKTHWIILKNTGPIGAFTNY